MGIAQDVRDVIATLEKASTLAEAARYLLDNTNPDNDNFGAIAALQKALDEYEEKT